VGAVRRAWRLTGYPTLLRLGSKLPSLVAPPLKRRGKHWHQSTALPAKKSPSFTGSAEKSSASFTRATLVV
jgi:hypothetical protein